MITMMNITMTFTAATTIITINNPEDYHYYFNRHQNHDYEHHDQDNHYDCVLNHADNDADDDQGEDDYDDLLCQQ